VGGQSVWAEGKQGGQRAEHRDGGMGADPHLRFKPINSVSRPFHRRQTRPFHRRQSRTRLASPRNFTREQSLRSRCRFDLRRRRSSTLTENGTPERAAARLSQTDGLCPVASVSGASAGPAVRGSGQDTQVQLRADARERRQERGARCGGPGSGVDPQLAKIKAITGAGAARCAPRLNAGAPASACAADATASSSLADRVAGFGREQVRASPAPACTGLRQREQGAPLGSMGLGAGHKGKGQWRALVVTRTIGRVPALRPLLLLLLHHGLQPSQGAPPRANGPARTCGPPPTHTPRPVPRHPAPHHRPGPRSRPHSRW
jgi:hypothetical protein